MRTSSVRNGVIVKVCVALGVVGSLVVQSRISRAAFEAPAPSGPGTEQVDQEGQRKGVVPGWEASGALGTGFSDTYGVGIGGRVGYTLPVGVYLGGQLQAYWGQNNGGQTGHATFVGAEVGYKIYPLNTLSGLEFRPYVFGGPAFISQSTSDAPYVKSKTGFAVQPGALTLFHIGQAFLGADFHFLATPSPFGAALLGSAGAGF
ncbi:MAG: outer membrane beta-barrel protein [Polyangiaceae bacterium]